MRLLLGITQMDVVEAIKKEEALAKISTDRLKTVVEGVEDDRSGPTLDKVRDAMANEYERRQQETISESRPAFVRKAYQALPEGTQKSQRETLTLRVHEGSDIHSRRARKRPAGHVSELEARETANVDTPVPGGGGGR